MEHIIIDHFFIETDNESKANLFAVEKVQGTLQTPPRIFKFLVEDCLENLRPLSVEEVNYR